ncbi:hypothetical protein MADA3029_940079 [Vibrio nigripulchritudo MADA3029]|uniref:Uncharacterized protein n=1 Tax=Vibrio nigripulchritudo SOn1 TaxID=1238450 RepID=A0AAV2VJN6_9VIBR|nr:hypothetical protein VIBNIFTn2_1630088 [Vibrio nigripulchritudo FTn2]CCN52366.1 hypothetical protein VIBNIMADA3021_1230078 [Vibrio nigripulchritudo MADA3021]CCN62193.1 hypothetical protein MADA3029_940079 [Vibrio nigripulchritudo MADA3029]CCN64212.1 hypothetical protein VIBNIPon4_20088 [Vibrio nigripulchritudo POn4]CCN75722.1 hypothetical protein VIBNISO65_1430034 [Vibrio nigripulchritudo SO65]CCO44891.1 hypothetical protein VIBNISOn1_1280038 [Vibrio nigripulchritudo SOn1]
MWASVGSEAEYNFIMIPIWFGRMTWSYIKYDRSLESVVCCSAPNCELQQ